MEARSRVLLVAGLVCLVAAPPVVWLASRGETKRTASGVDPATAAAAGCELQTFEHGVTNDPVSGRAYEREALFGSHPVLPRNGWNGSGSEPDLPTVIHALSHGFLVVKYKADLSADDRERLKQWSAGDRAGVVVVPGGTGLRSGFAAIRWGHGLACADASSPAVQVLDQFERRVQASLP